MVQPIHYECFHQTISLTVFCLLLVWTDLTNFLFQTKLMGKKIFDILLCLKSIILHLLLPLQYFWQSHDLLGRCLRVALSSYHPKVKLFESHVMFLWFQTVTMLPLQYFRNWMEIMEKTLVHPHKNIAGFLQERSC